VGTIGGLVEDTESSQGGDPVEEVGGVEVFCRLETGAGFEEGEYGFTLTKTAKIILGENRSSMSRFESSKSFRRTKGGSLSPCL